MFLGINKVIIIGNLGSDPKVVSHKNDLSITYINVATSRYNRYKNENNYTTEWHSITLYDNIGKICNKYLKKGSRVYVEGYIKTNTWKDEKNNQQKRFEIVATNVQFLDSRNIKPNDTKGKIMPDVKGNTVGEFDDDIPF